MKRTIKDIVGHCSTRCQGDQDGIEPETQKLAVSENREWGKGRGCLMGKFDFERLAPLESGVLCWKDILERNKKARKGKTVSIMILLWYTYQI